MKLNIDSYIRHAHHEVMVDTTPRAHNVASLRCKNCDKHIKWLSKSELMAIKSVMASTTHHGTKQGVKTRPVRKLTARRLR